MSTNRSDVVTRLDSRVVLNGWANTEGKVWVGAQVSQPNWVATVATRGVIRPGEGSGRGESTTRKGGDQWGELPCCDPRPMEGEPSNTHCTVRPSSQRGSGVSILRATSEGPCPPLVF